MAKGKYQDWLTEDGLTILRGLARSGKTDEEIADEIGVAEGTLYDWKKRYPEISEAIKKGKDIYDVKVEDALFDCTTGYYKDEDVLVQNADGSKSIRRIKKWHPPNVTAIIFWLKNRKPSQWRDRHQQEVEIKKPVSESASEIESLLLDLEAEEEGRAVDDEPPKK